MKLTPGLHIIYVSATVSVTSQTYGNISVVLESAQVCGMRPGLWEQ